VNNNYRLFKFFHCGKSIFFDPLITNPQTGKRSIYNKGYQRRYKVDKDSTDEYSFLEYIHKNGRRCFIGVAHPLRSWNDLVPEDDNISVEDRYKQDLLLKQREEQRRRGIKE
jgi:hypothetical protein